MPSTRISEPRESYDAFGEGLEGDAELTPMHLINHPSYQEMGDNKRRTRTRRSRIGINGANGKDETRLVTPLAFVNDSDLDLDADSDIAPTPEIPSLLSDTRRERDVMRTPTLGKAGWTERTERTKVKIDPIKPVVEPPQIVSVEMTVQEQDMFALMGISPSVKLEQEVKNPKSVIFNIVQPGQTSTSTTESTSTSESISELTVSERTNSELTKVKIPIPKVEVEELSLEPLIIDPPVQESSTIGFESFTDEEELSSTSSTPNRRRRRRSSAIEEN
jgi:ribonuclease E